MLRLYSEIVSCESAYMAHFLICGIKISLQLTDLVNKLKAVSVVYPNSTTYGLHMLLNDLKNNYEEPKLIFSLMKLTINLFQLQCLTLL